MSLILLPIVVWAFADMYFCYRFVKNPDVKTWDGIKQWWSIKSRS